MSENDPYRKLYPPSPTPTDETCSCPAQHPAKLMCALGYNPLHCMECNKEILPSSLGIGATLVDGIANWRAIYDAIDRLWLDSAEYELWAEHELAEISSPVNRRGREISSAINEQHKCYYWYFQNQSVDDFEPISNCPVCEKLLDVYTGGIFRQLTCEPCGLVTVGE